MFSQFGRRGDSRAPGIEPLTPVRSNAGGGERADTVRTLDAVFQEVSDWSPDGQTMLVAAISPVGSPHADTGWNLWSVPLDGGAPTPYVETGAFERVGRYSPDGRWVVWEDFDRGLYEIYIDSYPVRGHQVKVATGTGGSSTWGRGGREILYVDGQNDLVSVPLEFVNDGVRAGRPTRLFRLPDGLSGIVTNDGERFLVSSPVAAPSGTSLQLILGWTQLVGR